MCSTNGEAPRKPLRSWSITNRLTVLFTISAIGLLCAAGAFLYRELKQTLRAEDESTLADKISVLRDILRERPEDLEALEEEIQWESMARTHVVYYGRLLDKEQVLIQSPGTESLLPSPPGFPPAAKTEVTFGKIAEFRASSGQTLLLTSADVQRGPGAQKQLVYQVALDISREKQILSNYRSKILLVMVLGALAAASASRWIASRGIEPIREITAAAQRVTASVLNERVSTRRWPRELGVLAAEFDRMLERLEDSFNRLSQFSADIAHELRAPINNITGASEVALLRSRAPEDYRKILASSLEESYRLTRIIDNLLFLARAENTDLLIDREWFQAKNPIESVRGFHEPLANELGVTLSSFGEAITFAEPALFRRAVSNLVSNAIKNTPPGGHVKIIVDHGSGFARIIVEDTGCGIKSENLPRLFDRFYRTEVSRVNDSNGVGLGLSIVKGIMNLHQGSVTIESQVGKGTRAELIFPDRPWENIFLINDPTSLKSPAPSRL